MSDKKCCVPGCAENKGSHKTLHGFPNPVTESDRFRTWVYAVGGDILRLNNEFISKYRRVCHAHFEERVCCRFNKISSIATPTLHMPGFSALKFTSTNQQRITRDFPENMPSTSKGPTNTEKDDSVKKNAIVKIVGPPKNNDHTYCRLLDQKYKDRIVEAVREDGTIVIGLEPEKIADAVDDVRDDNADSSDDDAVRKLPTPVEVPELPNELFSWEKTDAILADDTDVVSDGIVEAPIPTLDLGDVSMYDDDKHSKDDTGSECTEYRCNECEETIKGFRYTCVQCADWDLCAACEARGAHDAHYVLRVPGQKPYNEIQAVLAAIRQEMLSENLFLPEIVASVKEEADEEVEAVLPEDALNLEADPLDECYANKYDEDDSCDMFEKYPDQDDEDGRPPEKRPRTNEDPLANPQDDNSHVDQLAHSELKVIDLNKIKTSHERRQQHCEQENGDTIQNPIENKEKQQILNYLYGVSKLSLKTSNTSHTHEKAMESSSKRTETHSKEIGAHGEGSGTHSKSILRHSRGLVTNRTYVRLPPGEHWHQVIGTMLKSQATVQLEDVVRKNKVLKNINMTDNDK